MLRHILSHLLIPVVLKEIHFNLLFWTKVISPRVLFSIPPQSKEATHLGSFRQRTKSWRMQERAKCPGLALQIRRTQPSRIVTRYTYTSWFTQGSRLCTFWHSKITQEMSRERLIKRHSKKSKSWKAHRQTRFTTGQYRFSTGKTRICTSPSTVLKGPCKRSQHCWPTRRNIVEPNMLRAFAHHVVCCCDLLEVVGWSLTTFKLHPTSCNKSQQHATTHNMVCKRSQHVGPNNVASCWPTMLRAFARAFTFCHRICTGNHVISSAIWN